MSPKNKFLFGGWISVAVKAYRHDKIIKGKNLPYRFEDWVYKECKIKKQIIYNYRNIYKLIGVALKLLNCRENILKLTSFVKNY